MAGWEGLPVVQQLQTTGRGEEEWHTTAYWVTLVDRQGEEYQLLFFEIDHIADTMAPVDVTPVLGLFGGAISDISHVRRPAGAVDFLARPLQLHQSSQSAEAWLGDHKP